MRPPPAAARAALGPRLPRAKMCTALKALENALGTRLLHRTIRSVALTQDGQAFYERSKDALADMDKLQIMFQRPSDGVKGGARSAMRLRDCVRVDISTVMASIAVSPRLPALLQLHPLLKLNSSPPSGAWPSSA